MFNIKINNMKYHFLLPMAFLAIFFIACEEDIECHECHIALVECCGAEEDHAPGEHAVDIGEFCGDDLADIEANGWVATQSISHDGEEEYAIGELVPANMIHCEEHASHDHDH